MDSAMETSLATYHIRLPTRNLCTVEAVSESVQFMVSTSAVRDANELHLLEYKDDTDEIVCLRVFTAGLDAHHMSPSFKAANLISMSGIKDDDRTWASGVYKLVDLEETVVTTLTSPVEQVLNLAKDAKAKDKTKQVIFNPEDEGEVLALLDSSLQLWDMNSGDSPKHSFNHNEKGGAGAVCWSSLDCSLCAFSVGSSASGIDLRAKGAAFSIPNTVSFGKCKSIQFNPNKENVVLLGGEDGLIRLYDTRNTDQPLIEHPAHSHWTNVVSFNPSYDQLLLSAGTDGSAKLWMAFEQSSSNGEHAAWKDDDGQEGVDEDKIEDGLIQSYDGHVDSLCGISWSAADPWCFASTCFDGSVALRHVPQAVKYSILL